MKEGNVVKTLLFFEKTNIVHPHWWVDFFPLFCLYQGFCFWEIFWYSEAPFIMLEEEQNGNHLLKMLQVMIQQQDYMVWLGPVSKVSPLVLHLPLALQCWPHSSPSGKSPSPSEQWLITGAQDRPGIKVCHCHTTYIKLFFLPPHSHRIWQPAPDSSMGKPLLAPR